LIYVAFQQGNDEGKKVIMMMMMMALLVFTVTVHAVPEQIW